MSASDPKKSPCRGCGKPIIWGVTEEGKKIPLDPTPPVYSVVALEYPQSGIEIVRIQRAPTLAKSGPETHVRELTEEGQTGPWLMAAYVSHFATCPEANRFSGSRKSP